MMPAIDANADAIFVATDLSVLNDAFAPADDNDVSVEGRVYRRLDPEYYAWLRNRMATAQTACRKGKLPPETFDALRIRFNAVHDQAIGLFGESILLEAVRHLDPKSYPCPGRTREEPEDRTHAEIPEEAEAPSRCSPEPEVIPGDPSVPEGWAPHAYPEEDPERFHFNQRVSKHALSQVDRIREDALAKGWTEAELYQTRGRFAFPCGQHYGVVCFIHRDQRLGKVTDRSIELICGDGHSLHFYRRNP